MEHHHISIVSQTNRKNASLLSAESTAPKYLFHMPFLQKELKEADGAIPGKSPIHYWTETNSLSFQKSHLLTISAPSSWHLLNILNH